MTVNVTARQFAFEFSYPGASSAGTIVTPELYMPEGRPVVFKIRSYDVIHSFFVPNFSEKIDAVPGIATTLRVTANRLGVYPVECTELCGAGHSLMRSSVHVVTPSAFETWLKAQKPNAPPPIGTPPPNAPADRPPRRTQLELIDDDHGHLNRARRAVRGERRGGQVGVPRLGRLRLLSHARGGRDDGDRGARTWAPQVVPSAKKAGMSLKAYISESITKPNAFITPGFQPNIMPQNFAQTLTPTQIQSLVDFIASVTK